MRRKKNRAEVWAGRGRHLYIVQAVALTVVPDTALHPRRKRESNMNLGSYAPFFMQTTPKMTWHRNCFSFWFRWSFAVLFMGLGAICADQATRGIPDPPRHVPVAPIRWLAREAVLKGRRLLPLLIPLALLTTFTFGVSKLNYQDSDRSWPLTISMILFSLLFYFSCFETVLLCRHGLPWSHCKPG